VAGGGWLAGWEGTDARMDRDVALLREILLIGEGFAEEWMQSAGWALRPRGLDISILRARESLRYQGGLGIA
jgi:hypothetical protein